MPRVFFVSALLLTLGCRSQHSDGEAIYQRDCAGCHGVTGAGDGPSSYAMRPPPRSFRQGLFKFQLAAAGELPPDEALDRTIRRGLNGTPMLGWELPEKERRALIAYLKTLSPRWKDEPQGKPLPMSKDVWAGKKSAAIERGRAVYHLIGHGNAGCASCHPGYLTRAELSNLSEQVTGEKLTEFNPELHRAALRETEYPLALDDAGEPSQVAMVLPPDFLFHKTKTVFDVGAVVDGRPYTEADQREDLYRVIASGIGGAAMPKWQGAISEENLWALCYYVQSLIELRGSTRALDLRDRLSADDAAAADGGVP